MDASADACEGMPPEPSEPSKLSRPSERGETSSAELSDRLHTANDERELEHVKT